MSNVILRYKKEIEDQYASILSDYATKKPREGSRDIPEKEEEKDNRGSFQRDRDRIIHTKAFRRLMYKTQVFVNHEGDHFRTRLTHTLEVSQFARGICKQLALNEDLAEAIALGHDLGHTPFGHAVEKYFNKELEKEGGFKHNEQSVRVVDYLEKRREGLVGLNLTYEVREGILKHTDSRSGIYSNLNPEFPCSTLEGQIVEIVDTIAYICHDLEDAIISGIVNRAIKNNPDTKDRFSYIIEFVRAHTGVKISTELYEDTFFIRQLIHDLIEKLTMDCYNNLKRHGISKLEDVEQCAHKKIKIMDFSEENKSFFEEFKDFIYGNVYKTQTIVTMDCKARTVAANLLKAYRDNNKLLPANWLYKIEHIDDIPGYMGVKLSPLRIICDYISSMTDRFALEENERLFNPSIKI